MNPPLRSLWWRIPAVLALFTLAVLVEVNLIDALPRYEGSVRFTTGMVAVYIEMLFLPWLRWRQ